MPRPHGGNYSFSQEQYRSYPSFLALIPLFPMWYTEEFRKRCGKPSLLTEETFYRFPHSSGKIEGYVGLLVHVARVRRSDQRVRVYLIKTSASVFHGRYQGTF